MIIFWSNTYTVAFTTPNISNNPSACKGTSTFEQKQLISGSIILCFFREEKESFTFGLSCFFLRIVNDDGNGNDDNSFDAGDGGAGDDSNAGNNRADIFFFLSAFSCKLFTFLTSVYRKQN